MTERGFKKQTNNGVEYLGIALKHETGPSDNRQTKEDDTQVI